MSWRGQNFLTMTIQLFLCCIVLTRLIITVSDVFPTHLLVSAIFSAHLLTAAVSTTYMCCHPHLNLEPTLVEIVLIESPAPVGYLPRLARPLSAPSHSLFILCCIK